MPRDYVEIDHELVRDITVLNRLAAMHALFGQLTKTRSVAKLSLALCGENPVAEKLLVAVNQKHQEIENR
jgi:hypothetical protein